jgi:hypothetical protein
MVDIPTPIPESTWDNAKRRLSGRPLDLLWRLVVTLVLILVIGIVASIGTVFGPVIAVAIAGALLSDDVRQAVVDLYNRNFVSVGINLRSFGETVRDALLFWR